MVAVAQRKVTKKIVADMLTAVAMEESAAAVEAAVEEAAAKRKEAAAAVEAAVEEAVATRKEIMEAGTVAVATATAADAAAAVKRKALLEIARSQSWKMKWYFNILRGDPFTNGSRGG